MYRLDLRSRSESKATKNYRQKAVRPVGNQFQKIETALAEICISAKSSCNRNRQRVSEHERESRDPVGPRAAERRSAKKSGPESGRLPKKANQLHEQARQNDTRHHQGIYSWKIDLFTLY